MKERVKPGAGHPNNSSIFKSKKLQKLLRMEEARPIFREAGGEREKNRAGCQSKKKRSGGRPEKPAEGKKEKGVSTGT